MNPVEFIKKIQAKPESDRKKILFFTVFFLMVIVFIIWVNNFKQTLNAGFSDNGDASLSSSSPFSLLKSNITQFVDIFKNGFDSIKNEAGTSSEATSSEILN